MRNFMTSVLFASALVAGGQAFASDGGNSVDAAVQQSIVAFNSQVAARAKAPETTGSVQVRAAAQTGNPGIYVNPAERMHEGSSR